MPEWRRRDRKMARRRFEAGATGGNGGESAMTSQWSALPSTIARQRRHAASAGSPHAYGQTYQQVCGYRRSFRLLVEKKA